MQQYNKPNSKAAYFLTQMKETFEEDGSTRITLFARLTKEYQKKAGTKIVNSVWVNIYEVPLEQATEKVKSLPEGLQKYRVPERIFKDLIGLSHTSPDDLHVITPIHMALTFKESS